MTPEERNLLDDLFQRLRQAEGQPRDPDAERFIRETIQAQPAAPYYMAQSLLVQEHALTAAQQRIADLERQLKDAQQQRPQTGGVGSFLGNALGLGRRDEPRPAPQPAPQPMAQPASPWGAPAPVAYPPQPQQAPGGGFRGPWGGGAPGNYAAPGGFAPQGGGFAPQGGGGSFMGGALQTAAGVAGGMLAANAISSLMHSGGSPFGAAAASHGMLPPSVTETTTINNYYGDSQAPDHGAAPETHNAGYQEASYQEAAYEPDNADYAMDDGDVGGGGGGDDDSSWA
ncbi:DUF2076 domain-containing protein [Azospirillum sp. sgz301742]